MTKQCTKCSKSFKLTQWDLEFYQRIDVPQPTLCPDCRQQRRLAWRNEHSLYNRRCDLCQRDSISIYPTNSPFTVYCHDCWWSDRWNALSYGQKIDWSRPFFEQWKELRDQVPHYSRLVIEATMQNSDYINTCSAAKNCYLIF